MDYNQLIKSINYIKNNTSDKRTIAHLLSLVSDLEKNGLQESNEFTSLEDALETTFGDSATYTEIDEYTTETQIIYAVYNTETDGDEQVGTITETIYNDVQSIFKTDVW